MILSTSLGTPERAPPRGALPPAAAVPPRTPSNGGFTFAEQPELEAPDARIIWCAEFDPATLRVTASPADPGDPDRLEGEALMPWLTVVADQAGEHAVLSDGWHRIRLDIDGGSLGAGETVFLQYHIAGIASAETKILPLRRLLDLCRHRRFSSSLYPPDRRTDRWLLTLRVHDAVRAGASQREIAQVLFGDAGDSVGAAMRSDSLRSRVRRLVKDGREMAAGKYRMLMWTPRKP